LLDAAQADYHAALALATDERWRFTDYEGHLRRGLGEIACQRSHWTEARAHFSAALDIARRLGCRWLETETFAATARCYLRIGDLDGAEKDATIANDYAVEGGWIALEADSLMTLAECRLRRRMPAGRELETAGDIVSRSGSRALEVRYLRLRSAQYPHE
jgi:tetratricopeptide (TPR) repeat protein